MITQTSIIERLQSSASVLSKDLGLTMVQHEQLTIWIQKNLIVAMSDCTIQPETFCAAFQTPIEFAQGQNVESIVKSLIKDKMVNTFVLSNVPYPTFRTQFILFKGNS